MYPDCDTLSNAPRMVESSVTEGRKTLKSRIELNKRLHYTPLVSVNSTPTSPFYTVLYANQVPTFLEC